jgi:hypothetical protein
MYMLIESTMGSVKSMRIGRVKFFSTSSLKSISISSCLAWMPQLLRRDVSTRYHFFAHRFLCDFPRHLPQLTRLIDEYNRRVRLFQENDLKSQAEKSHDGDDILGPSPACQIQHCVRVSQRLYVKKVFGINEPE